MYFNDDGKITNVHDAYEEIINIPANKALQKEIIKKVSDYNETDVFKVHEIIQIKLSQAPVSRVNLSPDVYLTRVLMILSNIKNYKRKPIHPSVCRHLVLEPIHKYDAMVNYNKARCFGFNMFCTKCGIETNEPLDEDKDLRKLVIQYFKIAGQYARHLNISFQEEMEKAKVLPTLDLLKLPELKAAAKSLGIIRFSTLRKAVLKDVIIKYCLN